MLNPYCSQTLGDLLGGELSDFSGFCLHYILCSVALRIGIQIQLHNFFFSLANFTDVFIFIFFIEQSGNFKVLQASLISKAWSTISEPFSKIIPPGISFSSMLRQKKIWVDISSVPCRKVTLDSQQVLSLVFGSEHSDWFLWPKVFQSPTYTKRLV